jgi:hypothetical protein
MGKIALLVGANSDPEMVRRQLQPYLNGNPICCLTTSREERLTHFVAYLASTLGQPNEIPAHCEKDEVPSFVRAHLNFRKNPVVIVPETEVLKLAIQVANQLGYRLVLVAESPNQMFMIDPKSQTITPLHAA